MLVLFADIVFTLSLKRQSKTLKLTILSCILIGAFGFALIHFFPEKLIQIFSMDDSGLLRVRLRGMNFFMFSLLVEGTVLLTSIYYQSINMVRTALFIQLGKIFIFLFPLLFILPFFFGLDGIWSAAPVTEYIMMFVALFMLSKEFKFLGNNGKTETEKNSKFINFKHAKRWKLREYPSVITLLAFGFEAGNPANRSLVFKVAKVEINFNR